MKRFKVVSCKIGIGIGGGSWGYLVSIDRNAFW